MKWCKIVLSTLLLLCSGSVLADWQLDNEQSTISFISIKKHEIAEAHSFNQLSGAISETGLATVEIDLSSVNTSIEIRDTRMKDMLFNVATYPKTTISSQLEQDFLDKLKVGDVHHLTLPITVTMHGTSQAYDSEVLIVYVNDKQLIVSAVTPLLVNASDFGFDDGIAKLTEIAGLPHISKAVPVSFVLTFGLE
ncbi:YceI family protein [Thalassotalea maritima]|uniref:YceI family protein n=1 Tax=Thalassotalea maritima TaxID=3242416 RepID=UPI0035279555